MHLVESFALNTGLQIDKPYIYDKFVPLSFKGRYITLQPYGKYESRKYDYWDEFMDVISPTLKEENITVVQLGLADERAVHGCYDMRGKTDFNQTAYLIRHADLHVGIDSFGIHFASGLDKKMVGLYCNMLPDNSGPYWSSKDKAIILQPERKEGERPSYSPIEVEKSINKITPERVVKSVCKLLDLNPDFPYKTIRVGKEYHARKVELIPATHIENHEELGVESIIIRMDEYFNEGALQQQLLRCPCSIVTDKPINLNLIKKFKNNINEFVYFIDDAADPKYLDLVKRTGVKLYLLSKLGDEDLNKLKLKFLDVGGIMQKPQYSADNIKELEGKNLKNIYYKSCSFSVFKNNIYQSSVFSEDNPPVENIRNVTPSPVIDDPDFWDQLDSYLLLEKED
jgi:hypothetical protein